MSSGRWLALPLALGSACGGDDSEGGGGGSSGSGGSGTGGASTGGAAGSGGGSTGGAAGSGGASTGGTAGSGGSDAGSDASSGGAGGADASACTPAPDAGAACNTVVNGGAFVAITQVTGAVPTGTGGTIADGHYFLTKLEGYPGNPLGNLTMKQTLDLCQGVGQLVGDENGPPIYHKTFTFQTNGTAITGTTTCSTQSPNVDVAYESYTATATALVLYSTTLKFAVTYTKQ